MSDTRVQLAAGSSLASLLSAYFQRSVVITSPAGCITVELFENRKKRKESIGPLVDSGLSQLSLHMPAV